MAGDNYGFPTWVKCSTLLLILLGVLGPILPGIQTPVGELFAFRLFLPVYLLALVSSIILYTQSKIRFPKVVVLLVGVLCLGIFSFFYATLTAQDTNITQLAVVLMRFILLFGIVITLNTRDWLYRTWILLVVLALVAFGVALFEYITGWHFTSSQIHQLPDRAPYSTWVTTWYTNINDLAFFSSMVTIPALVLGLNSNTNSRRRLFFIGVWITSAYMTIHLGARAATLACFIGFTVASGLTYSNTLRQTLGEVPTRVGKMIPPLFGLFFTGLFVLVPNPITDVGSSTWIRWQLQKTAILEGELWGYGFGSSVFVINQSSINTENISSPHSWYGAFLTDTGILGLILFLVFYGSLMIELVRKSSLQDPILIMSITSLVTLPIAGLGPSNVLYLPTFWIIIALSISTLNTLFRVPET